MFGKKGKAKGGKAGATEFFDCDKKDLAELFEGSLSNKFVILVNLNDGF